MVFGVTPWKDATALGAALSQLCQRVSTANSLTVRSSPTSVLKLEIYALAEVLRSKGAGKVAIDALKLTGRRPSGLDALRNCTYHHLLKALPQSRLDRSEEERIAFELQYARRHKIAGDLLIGFLLQSGGQLSFRERILIDNFYEPWFEGQLKTGAANKAGVPAAIEASDVVKAVKGGAAKPAARSLAKKMRLKKLKAQRDRLQRRAKEETARKKRLRLRCK